MEEAFDIREVVRRTGLTSRALRFYEARGLLKPHRAYSGRRLYGRGELERINQILALKRAGLTLAQIQRLTSGGRLDLAGIIDAQLDALEEQRRALDEAKRLLLTAKSRIDRGEPIDCATFCSLIRNGEKIMEQNNWDKVIDRYFTPEQQAEWASTMKDLPVDFDQAEYNRQWVDLGGRIEAALPLDTASPEAHALFKEWKALLEPFKAIATSQMFKNTGELYARMDEWQDVQQPPFSKAVWDFIVKMCEADPQEG